MGECCPTCADQGQDDITYLNHEAHSDTQKASEGPGSSKVHPPRPQTALIILRWADYNRHAGRNQEGSSNVKNLIRIHFGVWVSDRHSEGWSLRSMPAFQLASRILPLGWQRCGLHMQIPSNIWKRIGTSNCITESDLSKWTEPTA